MILRNTRANKRAQKPLPLRFGGATSAPEIGRWNNSNASSRTSQPTRMETQNAHEHRVREKIH
jgi:hypothetical protein